MDGARRAARLHPAARRLDAELSAHRSISTCFVITTCVVPSFHRFFSEYATRPSGSSQSHARLREWQRADGLWSATAGGVAPEWVTTTCAVEALANGDEADLGTVPTSLVELQQGPPHHGPAAGAVFLAHWYAKDPAVCKDLCPQLAKALPAADGPTAKTDFYGWYATTQAMQFQGEELWTPWWQALVATATATQRADGNCAGSWDPRDVRGKEGGRVYATAAMLMALEVTWRKEYRDK